MVRRRNLEAIWKIKTEDFPAFIVIDDKGNDSYVPLMQATPVTLIR